MIDESEAPILGSCIKRRLRSHIHTRVTGKYKRFASEEYTHTHTVTVTGARKRAIQVVMSNCNCTEATKQDKKRSDETREAKALARGTVCRRCKSVVDSGHRKLWVSTAPGEGTQRKIWLQDHWMRVHGLDDARESRQWATDTQTTRGEHSHSVAFLPSEFSYATKLALPSASYCCWRQYIRLLVAKRNNNNNNNRPLEQHYSAYAR